MAGLGWQEIVILAVILLAWIVLLYLLVQGVRAATCGLSFSEFQHTEPTATCSIRQHPVWLVAILTVITNGSYFVVWFGVSWAELKRLRRDPGMNPYGHAFSLLIPVLGLLRVHAHFRMMDRICSSRHVPSTLNPLFAVVAIAVAMVSLLLGAAGVAPAALTWIGAIVMAAVAASGQQTLNHLWSEEFGESSRSQIAAAEWIVLLVWGIFFMVGVVAVINRAVS